MIILSGGFAIEFQQLVWDQFIQCRGSWGGSKARHCERSLWRDDRAQIKNKVNTYSRKSAPFVVAQSRVIFFDSVCNQFFYRLWWVRVLVNYFVLLEVPMRTFWLGLAMGVFLSACGTQTAAVSRGVGSECTQSSDCTESGQTCLSFKGGYCGIKDCTANSGCPTGSACVAHTDGSKYCFLQCTEKADCNANRTTANEANCAANVTYVEAATTGKACVPPAAR